MEKELVLTDIADEYTLEEVREATGFAFETIELNKINVF